MQSEPSFWAQQRHLSSSLLPSDPRSSGLTVALFRFVGRDEKKLGAPGMESSWGWMHSRMEESRLIDMALLLLRTRRYVPSSTAYASDETCCICQEDYDEGEDVGMLSCGHGFHAACVGRWLTQRNVCPICRRTGLQPAV
ncbi:unnamed protein product [Spirodela intermedia]|uniref:RING-type E3 ubiquitin transferase n=1 Tax=Spirodela intermedia TaxID=51605 RepID=A0A7I8JQX8_SPIIN|nr:unnamed protein product [Spirodela intermedia]CAA6672554.1 unnamed protein product [Spirodela intermedia]